MKKENLERANAIQSKISRLRSKAETMKNEIKKLETNISIVKKIAEKEEEDLEDYDRSVLFVSRVNITPSTNLNCRDAIPLYMPVCDVFEYIIVGLTSKIQQISKEIIELENQFDDL